MNYNLKSSHLFFRNFLSWFQTNFNFFLQVRNPNENEYFQVIQAEKFEYSYVRILELEKQSFSKF